MIKIIDISTWQKSVDYAKVKASGVQAAIVRCGVTLWGAQDMEVDGMFEKHYAGFKAVGMPLGTYYYSAADTVAKAKEEAKFCISLLKGKKFEYPVYYDIENNERQGSLSKALLTDICIAFCEELEAAGYFVGVYANTDWFTRKLDHAKLSSLYTIWLADYRGENADKSLKRDVWQYTSSGKVDGISGNVDMNECYRDFTAEIKKYGKNGYSAESGSETKPQPTPQERTYTVKPNDSFWKIAEEQLGDGTRYKELAAYNGMSTDTVIHPGDVLKIPVTSSQPAERTYTVKPNDSFWRIAEQQLGDGTRYKELAAYNGMSTDTVIHPGDVLKLPK